MTLAGWVELDDPTDYVTLNAAWDRHGDIALLCEVAARAVVLGAVEMRKGDGRPIDLAAVLRTPYAARTGVPDGWKVAQDTRSGALSGSAIAVAGPATTFASVVP